MSKRVLQAEGKWYMSKLWTYIKQECIKRNKERKHFYFILTNCSKWTKCLKKIVLL